jgi:N-acetylglucosamine-6-phosphate deacetylase
MGRRRADRRDVSDRFIICANPAAPTDWTDGEDRRPTVRDAMPVFNDYELRVRCDRLYTPYELHEDYVVDIAGGRIRSVAPAAEAGDPSTKTVIHEAGTSVVPGFIDLHIHGSRGHDVMDGTRDSLATVSATLARHGTTSFLATTLSAPDSDTETAIRGFAAHGDRLYDGAAAIGLHLEGPFLNPVRRGTHNAAYLRAADGGAFRRWIELSGNRIRKITVTRKWTPASS